MAFPRGSKSVYVLSRSGCPFGRQQILLVKEEVRLLPGFLCRKVHLPVAEVAMHLEALLAAFAIALWQSFTASFSFMLACGEQPLDLHPIFVGRHKSAYFAESQLARGRD